MWLSYFEGALHVVQADLAQTAPRLQSHETQALLAWVNRFRIF
jgi:hypothetical protein